MGEKRASAQRFDTCAVENVIDLVMKYNPEAIMAIKRTILGGAMTGLNTKTPYKDIFVHTKHLFYELLGGSG